METLEAMIGRGPVRALDRAVRMAARLPALRPPRPRPPRLPPAWALARADRLLATRPELARKLVDRDASRIALARMFRAAGSGGPGRTRRPGRYIPAHTRAGAAELRALLAHARDPAVTQISLVPSRSRRHSPDMVVRRGGRAERVEVSSVTGGGRGYAHRGTGGFRPLTAGEIHDRLVQKALGAQLSDPLMTASMGPVPIGGTVDLVVPPSAMTAGAAGLATAATVIGRDAPAVTRLIVRPWGERPDERSPRPQPIVYERRDATSPWVVRGAPPAAPM
jgi:hypothetical protein